MSDREDVSGKEDLARFILQSSHYRRSDETVKPDAFVPHPYNDLSVTRHLQLQDSDLWQIGADVARTVNKPLYGRCDLKAQVFLDQKLAVRSEATAKNPNHAVVAGWPLEKSAQKSIAQQIAYSAGKVRLYVA